MDTNDRSIQYQNHNTPSPDLPLQEFLEITTKSPIINIDLFITDEKERLLLSWRDDEYCGTGWHIIGGIIRHGETIEARIYETAIREIGFIPEIDFMPCKLTETFLEQKYRNHYISLLYKCICNSRDVKTVREDGTRKPGDLCWFDRIPDGFLKSMDEYRPYLEEYFREKRDSLKAH